MKLARIAMALVWLAGLGMAQEVWVFDRLDKIGGHNVSVLGHPRIIDTPAGKAMEFNGVDDGLLIDVHPLAGAETFTWEAIFRPDGGNAEQRWFHLEENPATGSDTDNRMLFEIRVIDSQWCLDAFNKSGSVQKALLNRQHLHPLGAWYHVAAVYDGKEFRSYINGEADGAAAIHLAPQAAGRASVGVRINKVFYFKGAVRVARFTRRALTPGEFWNARQANPMATAAGLHGRQPNVYAEYLRTPRMSSAIKPGTSASARSAFSYSSDK